MAVYVDSVTPDSQAIALLCTSLALPRGEAKPLSGTEWSALATTIRDAHLRPGALLSMSASEIAESLSLTTQPASRLAALLRRGGQLAFELERLSSRGISLITRADEAYPALYKERLRRSAPPALYVAGDTSLLQRSAGAVVGSRDADADSIDFATALGRRLASDGSAVVSGAARGVDTTAMLAALDAEGAAIGVIADSLEKAVRRQDLRVHISEGSLLLLSSYHPNARFTIGGAMGRNRLIYCLSEAAFVVASGAKGGTREGALEDLKAKWVPLFVRADKGAPAGNAALLRAGALPLLRDELDEPDILQRLTEQMRVEQLAVDLVVDDPSLHREGGLRSVGVQRKTETGGQGETRSGQARREKPGGETERRSEAQIGDAFQIVWPILEAFLQSPRTLPDVRSYLALEPSQTRAWIGRALAEGRIVQLERPRRYLIAPEPSPSLFEG